MKVLVTGATGFIGSQIVKRLLQENFDVSVIVRPSSDRWRIQDVVDRLRFLTCDLTDTTSLLQAVQHEKPDVLIHLATFYRVEHRPDDMTSMININVLGTLSVLEAARQSGTKLVVNTSTCFVYRSNDHTLSEKHPLDPFNLYALTKLQSEQACDFYATHYGLPCVTLRLFPPYGPYDHERRLIFYVIRNLIEKKPLPMTSGTQQWDFVYADDIVEAFIKVLQRKGSWSGHERFNIGTGQAVSVRAVVMRIKELLQSPVEPSWGAVPQRPQEIMFLCAGAQKAKEVLQWSSRVPILDEGIQKTVAWYQQRFSSASHFGRMASA